MGTGLSPIGSPGVISSRLPHHRHAIPRLLLSNVWIILPLIQRDLIYDYRSHYQPGVAYRYSDRHWPWLSDSRCLFLAAESVNTMGHPCRRSLVVLCDLLRAHTHSRRNEVTIRFSRVPST